MSASVRGDRRRGHDQDVDLVAALALEGHAGGVRSGAARRRPRATGPGTRPPPGPARGSRSRGRRCRPRSGEDLVRSPRSPRSASRTSRVRPPVVRDGARRGQQQRSLPVRAPPTGPLQIQEIDAAEPLERAATDRACCPARTSVGAMIAPDGRMRSPRGSRGRRPGSCPSRRRPAGRSSAWRGHRGRDLLDRAELRLRGLERDGREEAL